MLRHATRAERVLYPCHNYKHAPVIKAVRARHRSGPHRQGPPGHAADVPQHARQGRDRAGGPTGGASAATRAAASRWTTAATPSTWRSNGCAPTRRRSARAPSTLGPFDTEDDFSCSLRFPTGVASAHLSWNAGVRKVIYTRPRRARRHPRRGRRHRGGGARANAGADGSPQPARTRLPGVSSARRYARTGWIPATSPGSTRCSTTSRGRSSAASSWGARRRRRSCACS